MHTLFMRRCLELAAKGKGKTGINPMVGAVLVRDGKMIAEGFHSEFGKSHAELNLLEKTEYNICSTDTLYVNLEPCCHMHKKTPPCTDMIIKSGIKHVVFGMRDPNPQVSGKGIAALRNAGIDVAGPVLEDECLRLNRGFVTLQKNSRPWITLKIARMVDGRIANPDGSMMKITRDDQNAWSHRCLRARHDGILVGVGTILTDDSRLTVRTPTPNPSPEGGGELQPYRIILDATLQIPLTATVVGDEFVSRTIVICAPDADRKKKREIESRGLLVMEVMQEARLRLRATDGQASRSHSECFDWSELWKALTTPKDSFYGISSILVEGGPTTWQLFQKAGMVDEEVTLVGA
ncbi:bifunctional diaminohydroxyphosphoribosylaminopyrimidine deaminase/5-amino-6-(5-phosphoribosylamino)uracil reductase RibD [Candidatus Peribacteria bacterium]|nr:bifunctional diaminohydroxyphosphoribosylaminopyrimidine deaminase/5-amino-6-(5-phosphoribosylamino)uracil reductase RibD [Candidatus Peribacteria bacterium]